MNATLSSAQGTDTPSAPPKTTPALAGTLPTNLNLSSEAQAVLSGAASSSIPATELSAARKDNIVTIIDQRGGAALQAYKPVFLLLVEYMYKFLYATNPTSTIATTLGRQATPYTSDALGGLTLTVSYPGGTGVRNKWTMEDVGIAVVGITHEIAHTPGGWKEFIAYGTEKGKPNERFVKIEVARVARVGAWEADEGGGDVTPVA